MAGAARILQVTLEPGHPLLEQGQGHRAPFWITAPRPGRIVQELHQGGTDLFCSPTSFLMFEGMPLPIPELEASVQRHRLIQSLNWPAAAGRFQGLADLGRRGRIRYG